MKNFNFMCIRQYFFIALLMTFGLTARSTVHQIPNTEQDTLEHFIENYYNVLWQSGDTIMLTDAETYVVNGTVDLYAEVTIMGDPSLDELPVLQFFDNGLRAKEDTISITLMNLGFNGDKEDGNVANYVLRFDQSGWYNYNNIVIENCEAYNFVGAIQLFKNQWTTYDSIIINNCIWHDFTGTAIDPRLNATSYFAITNSTFYNIEGGFFANPYYSDGTRDVIAQEIVMNHNTFYNIANGSNSLVQINDPSDASVDFTFTNNIVAELTDTTNGRPFRINEAAGVFGFSNSLLYNFESSRDDGAYNLDSVADLSNVTVADIVYDYPAFADTTEGSYDFTLTYFSPAAEMATDGGFVGDPRWIPTEAYDPVHLIPNTSADTLEHFIENYYNVLWKSGDTIMLTDAETYVVSNTPDVDGSIIIMADPDLNETPVIQFTDNGFRVDGESEGISITIKDLNLNGFNDDSTNRANFIVRFEQSIQANHGDIVIENCEAWGFEGGIDLSTGKNSYYENIIVDNVIWHDFVGDYCIDPNINFSKNVEVTNSTFYEIGTGFIKNPSFQRDDNNNTFVTKTFVIDHNTFYKVAGNNNALIQINDPADASVELTFSNNIVSKLYHQGNARPFRINEAAGTFEFTNSVVNNYEVTDENKKVYNLDSVAKQTNITLTEISYDDPEFADTTNADFSIPETSTLITASTTGGVIGDPRWSPYSAGRRIHEIPNTSADTLEHFIENYYGTEWQSGDTIMLVDDNVYVVQNIVDIPGAVVILGDPDLDERPVIQLYDNGFRPIEDSISITIKDVDFNGLDDEGNYASYILCYTSWGLTYFNNVVIENCDAWNMDGGIQLYKNKNATYDTVIINNCIWHDFTGTAIDPKLNATSYFAVTNSTFYNITGDFFSNPYYTEDEDYIPQEIVIDHNTFYNIVGANESLIQINDPSDGQIDFTFSNNIVSTIADTATSRPFIINEAAGEFVFTNSVIHDFETSREGVFNLDTVAYLSNVTVTEISYDDPAFADTANADFSIPDTSALLTAGTDGGCIGDPRWEPDEAPWVPGEGVHEIPNTSADTLEHFIENYFESEWESGDTILLVSSGEYEISGTIDMYGELTIMSDPDLTVKPVLVFNDNGFRPKQDSISITLEGFTAIGWDPVDSSSYAGYLLRFDQTIYKNYNNIVIRDIEAYGFQGGIQLYKGKGSVYDSLIIDDVIFHDMSNQLAVDIYQNQVKYISITNSTFYNIQKGFLGEFYTDSIYDKEVIIERNTFYNIIEGATLFAVHNLSDESLDLTYQNNIACKLWDKTSARPFRISETAGNIAINNSVFNDFESSRDDGAYNLSTVEALDNVTVSEVSTGYPSFRDSTTYDFMLPDNSELLYAATDGGAIGDPRWIPRYGITIDELTETVTEDDTVQMSAEVVFSDGADLTVSWSVENNYDGTTGEASIDAETGELIAVAEGKVLVIATSNYNSNVADSLVVEIEAKKYVTSITLESTNYSGATSTIISKSDSYLDIKASVFPVSAADRSVTWSQSGDGRVTFTETGTYTVRVYGYRSGEVTVTATANDGSGISGSVDLTLSNQVPVTEVSVYTDNDVTEITDNGGTLQMYATVTPDSADITTVTWSVDDEDIAAISEDGLLTAVSNGVVTVKAKANDNSYKNGTMEITISGQVSIEEKLADEFKVMPNPASDYFVIQSDKTVEITIFNILGKAILIREVEPMEQVNISSFEPGIYMLKVTSGSIENTLKLLKK